MPKLQDIDFSKKTFKIRPQLHRYLSSVSHLIDGRSYSKISDIFTNSNKPKLIQTYESLKKQVEKPSKLITVKKMNQKKPTKKEYLVNVVLYSKGPQFKGQKPWKWLYMLFPSDPHRQLQVKGPDPFPGSIIKKLVYQSDRKEFTFGINIFLTDADFYEYFRDKAAYIDAFKIFSVDTIVESKSKHNPLSKKLKNAAQKISVHNTYIETKLNTAFNTFKEALANPHYVNNECWLNTIQDVYGDTLMSSKKREVVNRAKILEVIGKTEETVKDGISVKDVMPFFEKYCLQLRVYE